MTWKDDPVVEPPKGGAWEQDEIVSPPKSIGGFAHNLASDIGDTAKGLGSFAKNMVTSPIDTTVKTATGIMPALYHEANRLGYGALTKDVNKGQLHPIDAMKQFGNALYEKPLTTFMDVLPAAGAAKKLMGASTVAEGASLLDEAAQAPKAAEMAETAIPKTGIDIAEMPKTSQKFEIPSSPTNAPAPLSMPEEAGNILKQPISTPPPPPAPEGLMGGLKKQIPDGVKAPLRQVEDVLTEKYGKAAKAPGAIENFGKALEQKARGMTVKELGGTPGQVRTLRDRFGEKMVNDLADLADQKGITKGFFNWQTGNEIKNLLDKSGKEVGAFRSLAKERGAIHNPQEIVNKIKAELDPIYLKGTGSSQKGIYLKALQDIQNSPLDVESLAETLSQKNRFIKKNKMAQPLGAATDVYNTASRINNDLISKYLKPTETEAYRNSLKDYSAAKVFDKMHGFTYGREMAGRTGPGSILNFVKDVGGRKVMEKVFRNVGKRMQTNPETFKSPTALSSDVLDSVGQALDEVIEQMGDQPTKL